jgi:hypothetical protein
LIAQTSMLLRDRLDGKAKWKKMLTWDTHVNMVDGALYKDILLAVAARKLNERSLTTAAEKLEQHIEQIGSSNERIMKGESDMLVRMTQRMNKNFDEIREEHNTRMKNVMADIRVLNDSMVA